MSVLTTGHNTVQKILITLSLNLQTIIAVHTLLVGLLVGKKKKIPHRQPALMHGSSFPLSRRGLLDPVKLAYDPHCQKAGS